MAAAAGTSSSATADGSQPYLTLGELEATLTDEPALTKFREFLRALDGKKNAAPEVKGRFERYLDFIREMKVIYDLPQSDAVHCRELLIKIQAEYFACPPSGRLSVTSQVALKKMSEHLKIFVSHKEAPINHQLTRPVFEDAYRKVQQKHDVFRKNYKPSMSLHTFLCLLS